MLATAAGGTFSAAGPDMLALRVVRCGHRLAADPLQPSSMCWLMSAAGDVAGSWQGCIAKAVCVNNSALISAQLRRRHQCTNFGMRRQFNWDAAGVKHEGVHACARSNRR